MKQLAVHLLMTCAVFTAQSIIADEQRDNVVSLKPGTTVQIGTPTLVTCEKAPSGALACDINGLCSNKDYPFQVVLRWNGKNVLGACFKEMENAIEAYKGLQATGQCL